MSDELKACPFCDKPFTVRALGKTTTGFEHDSPGCPLDEQSIQVISIPAETLIEQLNTRPIEDALRAEVDRLTAERDAALEACEAAPEACEVLLKAAEMHRAWEVNSSEDFNEMLDYWRRECYGNYGNAAEEGGLP